MFFSTTVCLNRILDIERTGSYNGNYVLTLDVEF